MPRSATFIIIALIVISPFFPSEDSPRVQLGDFEHETPAEVKLRVFMAMPEEISDATPIVIVMHGMGRNAARYRDDWIEAAQRFGLIVAVPEFDAERFPGSRGYNLGNRERENGDALPKSAWSFTAIESLFDDIKKRTGSRQERYALYGHSAGAQFVHRFLYFVPEARVLKAVAANAGWYTMPDNAAFPYGLTESGVSDEALLNALRTPLVVLLGEADNDPNHRSLRRTPEAMAQGAHRFARGRTFFELGQAAAEQAGVEFAWQLQTVPNVAHSNRGMAGEAAAILAAED